MKLLEISRFDIAAFDMCALFGISNESALIVTLLLVIMTELGRLSWPIRILFVDEYNNRSPAMASDNVSPLEVASINAPCGVANASIISKSTENVWVFKRLL